MATTQTETRQDPALHYANQALDRLAERLQILHGEKFEGKGRIAVVRTSANLSFEIPPSEQYLLSFEPRADSWKLSYSDKNLAVPVVDAHYDSFLLARDGLIGAVLRRCSSLISNEEVRYLLGG